MSKTFDETMTEILQPNTSRFSELQYLSLHDVQW